MKVLILTRRGDEVVTRPIVEALARRGGHPVVLESNGFPGAVGLSWSGPGQGWLSIPGEGRLDLAEIGAIRLRRESVGADLPADWPSDVRAAATLESREMLMGALLDSPAFWLDPPHLALRAQSKALQLALAREVGLEVPATLETNDPGLARAFLARYPGGVITKMYNDFRLGDGTVYTNTLGPQDLDALDDLAACPTVLQERVPKARELRVVVVGEQVFAAALESPTLPGAGEDWRRVGAQTLADWRPYTLPEEVRAAMLRLHDRLGTNYGSADLIVTPEGRHVLLENNVNGESFWLYEMAPLADAIAAVLLNQAPRRGSA